MIFDLKDPVAIKSVQMYLQYVRGQGMKIGLTSGSFDLIHPHHLLYFTRCARCCDVLIVGVDSDELVRERKGEGRPVTYDSRRLIMVDALKPVTFAFIMNTIDDFGLAARLAHPDFIFKNDTFRGREHEIIGREYSKEVKIILDVIDHSSTTDILNQAAKLVGARAKQ